MGTQFLVNEEFYYFRLMDAVEEDDAVKLQEILSSLPKDDASVQDVLAEALFEAVKTGKEEMVKLLVMSGEFVQNYMCIECL